MNHCQTMRLLTDTGLETQAIALQALDHIDSQYSTSGDPRQNAAAELYLPYHNGRHTRFVLQDIRILRNVVGLTPAEYDVAISAGSAHDVVQELDAKAGENEDNSAGWLADKMADQPDAFTKTEIDYAQLAILGTKTIVDMFFELKQRATMQDYPSKRAELIAHVVAAADPGRLYTPDGPLNAHLLFQEQHTGGSGQPPSLDDFYTFQKRQLQF